MRAIRNGTKSRKTPSAGESATRSAGRGGSVRRRRGPAGGLAGAVGGGGRARRGGGGGEIERRVLVAEDEAAVLGRVKHVAAEPRAGVRLQPRAVAHLDAKPVEPAGELREIPVVA